MLVFLSLLWEAGQETTADWICGRSNRREQSLSIQIENQAVQLAASNSETTWDEILFAASIESCGVRPCLRVHECPLSTLCNSDYCLSYFCFGLLGQVLFPANATRTFDYLFAAKGNERNNRQDPHRGGFNTQSCQRFTRVHQQSQPIRSRSEHSAISGTHPCHPLIATDA